VLVPLQPQGACAPSGAAAASEGLQAVPQAHEGQEVQPGRSRDAREQGGLSPQEGVVPPYKPHHEVVVGLFNLNGITRQLRQIRFRYSFFNGYRFQAKLLIKGPLDFPSSIGFGDGLFYGIGHLVGIENNFAVDGSGGSAGHLNQSAEVSQKSFSVGI
jgi:hypothetical protein